MNGHGKSQHSAQRHEPARELTELLNLLETVDRQITPEHIAQRFRELLHDIGDDGPSAPPSSSRDQGPHEVEEVAEEERTAKGELARELMSLRDAAIEAGRPGSPGQSPVHEIAESPNAGPWHFDGGRTITIVCAKLPQQMLKNLPYTDPVDPDFIDMSGYSDLDSLMELYGHVRAANPASQVNIRASDQLRPDDNISHLVLLGGVDWNMATSSALERLQLPVKQVSDWDNEEAAYFEVTDADGRKVAHRPHLEELCGRAILREDVALFARGVSPFNRKCFVTICNGIHGSGTYGAMRALTDALFRDGNAEYLRDRFTNSDAFCILTRVKVHNGVPMTPDWTLPETTLFEWSRSE